MKPSVVIESLRLTYDTLYMNAKYNAMLKGAYVQLSEVEKEHMTRFLFDGFSFNKVMQWQPHKDWYVPEVKEFLNLYKEYFIDKNNSISGYMMVEDFLKQLATYTVEMLNEKPVKEDWAFWFLSMYLRPAYDLKGRTPEPQQPKNETVFLIEQLWVDELENHPTSASGYEVKGYVKTASDAQRMVDEAGKHAGKGWPIPQGEFVPNLKSKEIKLLK